MASHGSVPWYDSPAREHPIKRWLRQRYGFDVPTWAISRYPVRVSAPVWLEQQRAGGS